MLSMVSSKLIECDSAEFPRASARTRGPCNKATLPARVAVSIARIVGSSCVDITLETRKLSNSYLTRMNPDAMILNHRYGVKAKGTHLVSWGPAAAMGICALES